jgi:pantoate--beta-alanine ligase
MLIIRNVGELRAEIDRKRRLGQRIGFVPTMGNLHAGHYSLIARARESCDFVVASIFVNPTQFGENEDFSRYPRTPEQDALGLGENACDLLFLPDVDAIYPFGAKHAVRVSVPDIGDTLEGASRPGHFDGVATVVARLFNLVQPDLAVFGSKDYQQLLVVRRMTRDLGFPVEIIGAPIVREANGLAMSSRNQYLDSSQREQAAVIQATLQWVDEQLEAGIESVGSIEMVAMDRLAAAGFKPDYVAIRRADDLGESPDRRTDRLAVLIAARLGNVRLIDNREWIASSTGQMSQ